MEYLGRIARSRAGRDKGGRFAVVGRADEAHVLIADGDAHKIAKPKKKKLMHLAFEKERVADIEALLALPGGVADAALRRALEQHEEGGIACPNQM
ncbi:MAG TPA: RNA-binding protein [Clostridia bacterium]|nr:RNA-binding protein [Clostridia bacterium]